MQNYLEKESVPVSRNGSLLILMTTVLWSFSAILSRLANISPILLNALRCVVALIITLVYTKFKLKINFVILLGAFCFTVTNVFYFMALQNTTAANAVVLQYTAPIFVLLESCIFFKKKPSLLQVVVLAGAFCGILLIFWKDLDAGNLMGNLYALLAGIAFSGVFFVNKMSRSSSIDATILGYGACALLGIFYIHEIPAISLVSWGIVLIMGVFQIGLAYILFSIGIKRCSSFSASIIGTFEVVLVPLWVMIFMDETPSGWAIVGGILILSAVILNLIYENKQAEKQKI